MESPRVVPETQGRVYGDDWSIANVAKLLRFNAARGVLRDRGQVTGGLQAINRDYIRTVSAHHLPSGMVVTFTHEEAGDCWHAALCFASRGMYLPWNDAVAEEWLAALFGEDRPRVREDAQVTPGGANPQGVRHFRLASSGHVR